MIKTDDIYIRHLHQIPDCDHFNVNIECDEQKECLFQGGETKALELCRKRLECETESFKNGKINPNLKKPIIFTNEVSLSPYLRFGCLSIRKLYWDIKNCYDKVTFIKYFYSYSIFEIFSFFNYLRIITGLKLILLIQQNNFFGENISIKCLLKMKNFIK